MIMPIRHAQWFMNHGPWTVFHAHGHGHVLWTCSMVRGHVNHGEPWLTIKWKLMIMPCGRSARSGPRSRGKILEQGWHISLFFPFFHPFSLRFPQLIIIIKALGRIFPRVSANKTHAKPTPERSDAPELRPDALGCPRKPTRMPHGCPH